MGWMDDSGVIAHSVRQGENVSPNIFNMLVIEELPCFRWK